MSKFHERFRELQALQCFGFMKFSVFCGISLFSNMLSRSTQQIQNFQLQTRSENGKIGKACAHLWYSKLDSTGNETWMKLAWHCVTEAIYKNMSYVFLQQNPWFLDFIWLSHAFKHWRLGRLAWATRCFSRGGCFGCTAREHHSFLLGKRLVKQSIWNSIKQARLECPNFWVDSCWILLNYIPMNGETSQSCIASLKTGYHEIQQVIGGYPPKAQNKPMFLMKNDIDCPNWHGWQLSQGFFFAVLAFV